MKRIFCVLLVCALLFSGGTSAIAADSIDDSGQQQAHEQQSTVTVGTLEELQAAVAAAESGDTIAISKCIELKNVSLITDKYITLIPIDNSVGVLIEMNKGSQLSGFNLFTNAVAVLISNYEGGEITIADCNFVGSENYYYNLVNITSGTAQISDCSFQYGKDVALMISASSVVTVERCSFMGNTTIMQGAGIHNSGECYVIDSTFTNNTAGVGGGIYNSGTMGISGCAYSGNKSTDTIGQDIVSEGTLSIIDETQDDAGYYEESTGDKIALPLADYTDTARLIWLTTEQSAEYFAPSSSPDDEEQEADTPAETPTEPPQQPEDGEGEDTPADNENPPTTPAPPQDEPDNDGEDDYTPPVVNRPTRPTRPVLPTPAPDPEEEPTPALVCGDAVIDASRSVVLLGYGDGQLHLDDNLTRAQMATIIYRLLDADSIARYDSADTVFVDVAPDAWHCRYITTIANAGIVCGVGNDSYDPDAPLTWGHIITVMSRFVAAQDCELQHIQYSGWAQDAVATAVALGWIADSAEFDPDSLITRGQLVEFVNGVLEQYR